jgi:hypothetical protein
MALCRRSGLKHPWVLRQSNQETWFDKELGEMRMPGKWNKLGRWRGENSDSGGVISEKIVEVFNALRF